MPASAVICGSVAFKSLLNSMIHQGMKNPLSGCPGQIKIFAGQVNCFLACPVKCISCQRVTGCFGPIPVWTPGRFGPIPSWSGPFGLWRFRSISGVGRFGPVLTGRFGPLYFI